MASIQINSTIPGPKSQEVLLRRAAALPTASARATDVVVAHARGALVTDVDGNTFIDFAGGIGMMNVGHNVPAVVNAAKKQMDQLIHTCHIVATMEPTVALAEQLQQVCPGNHPKKAMFGNSGSEVVDMAVNIARYYTKRPGVLVFEGAYHGRTYLTMGLTSKYNLFKKGYGSMASDIYRLPVPNMYRTPKGMSAANYLQYSLDQLDHAMTAQVDPSALAAILIEPVQGEAGFITMPPEFLQKLRALCDQHGIVLIFDEIQCGMGRTGKLFACEHANVVPDIITTAKSLGAGFPIAALVGRADIMDCMHIGAIGGTYSGSPVVCAAAIEALNIINTPAFLKKSADLGEQLRRITDAWKKKYPLLGDSRGVGSMRAIEFVKNRDTKEPDPDVTLEIIKDAVSKGVLLIRAGLFSNCIRMLPPVSITKSQVIEAMSVLEGAIARAHDKRGIHY
jgi:4-aminobutyrate aminotransferase / (S)-3-amino-2-methylpropionate transaminase / 5-aminovalerate transaminase